MTIVGPHGGVPAAGGRGMPAAGSPDTPREAGDEVGAPHCAREPGG